MEIRDIDIFRIFEMRMIKKCFQIMKFLISNKNHSDDPGKDADFIKISFQTCVISFDLVIKASRNSS